MKNFLSIAAFALLLSLFYTAVGNVLPQYPSYPPPRFKLGETMATDDLVAGGSVVFEANCSQCHKIGGPGRCPDLAGVGERAHGHAADRAKATGKGYEDADYLLEAICKPGDFLVQGFSNIMPPQGKLLQPGQIIAVAAFLQDQGGDVTLSLADAAKANAQLDRFGCQVGGPGAAAGGVAVVQPPAGTPEEIWTTFGCNACHALEGPERLIGPSLQDVGKRLQTGEIYEAILTPDAKLAAGTPPYTPGMMSATLGGNGFYERMKPADYQALVEWLAKHKG